MKIEKISETQIKFLLTKEDLQERNLKIAELAYGSDKAQALFRDIMEQALEECGFEANNIPLMIEAIPVSNESVMIIVSKVSDDCNPENSFTLTPPTMDIRKYKKKSLISESSNDEVKDDERLTIYSFKNLDDVTEASTRLSRIYNGTNLLYKFEGNFFLVAHNDNEEDNLMTDDIDSVLCEYGQKHVSNLVTKYYLIEHGEVIIKNNALKVLLSI